MAIANLGNIVWLHKFRIKGRVGHVQFVCFVLPVLLSVSSTGFVCCAKVAEGLCSKAGPVLAAHPRHYSQRKGHE